MPKSRLLYVYHFRLILVDVTLFSALIYNTAFMMILMPRRILELLRYR